jgi:hypothetical protein
MARSRSGISAILWSTSVSESALSPAFSSRTRSLAAAFSSAENPLDDLPAALVLLVDVRVLFMAGFFSAMVPFSSTSGLG